MLRTVMFSLIPATPGRRQQIPRMIKSIFTPACDAAYRASMISRSTREFILAMMRAGFSPRALSRSFLISAIIVSCVPKGEMMSFFAPGNG